MLRRPAAPWALLVPAVVVVLATLLPVGYLLVRAAEAGPDALARVVLQPRTAALLGRSLGLAAAVTVTAAALGTALAWLVVRTRLPGRAVWGVLVALPLAVPTYVAGFSYVSIAPGLAGFSGAFLVLTLYTYPYVYLPVAAALRGTDPSLEEVSRSLGAGPWRTFGTVTLRQVRPALSGGALLVATYVLSDFGAVSLLRYDAFTRVIYASYQASFDRSRAAILGCLLVLLTLGLLALRTRGRERYSRVGRGAARPPRPVALGRWHAPALLLVGTTVVLSLGVPAWTLVRWTAEGVSSGVAGQTWRAAGSSLLVSVLGAVVTAGLALPVGLAAARYRGRTTTTLERASYVGHALPGIVVALAFVFAATRVLPALYQRLPVLVAAYVVLFLPLAVAAVVGAAEQAPAGLEDVARSLGRRPLSVLTSVTLPLGARGALAGLALVFLTCMKELPATLLLRPTGLDTLAVRVWSETSAGAYAAAAPAAALLVAVAAVPTALLARPQA